MSHKPRSILVIAARGRGSSLCDKNIYPLNGKPLLAHVIDELGRAGCVDGVAVWTDAESVAAVARACGAMALPRPREMVHYQSGFYRLDEWQTFLTNQVDSRFGQADYWISVNCNYALFRAATLDAMMARIVATPSLGMIYAVSPVRPPIYLENHISRTIMPLFPSLCGMVRRMGVSITEIHTGATARAHHRVDWEEGLDFQHEDDIPFVQYLLRKRAGTGPA